MATATALPAEGTQKGRAGTGLVGDAALAVVPTVLIAEPLKLSLEMAKLPVELEVSVPVREFRVRDLVRLDAGQVIETQWGHTRDMPLLAGDVQLAWSEFEVVETKLAVRVTRLA